MELIEKTWLLNLDEKNLELKQSHIDLEKSAKDMGQTKLGYFPTLGLSASHEWNLDGHVKENHNPYEKTPLKSTAVYLTLTWTFFDWFNTYRDIGNSQREYEISRIRLNENRQKKSSEIQTQIEQNRILSKSIEASRLIMLKAEQQQLFARELYKLGRITMLKMQQSNTQYFEARNALMSRLKDKYVLSSKLLYNSGETLLPNAILGSWTN